MRASQFIFKESTNNGLITVYHGGRPFKEWNPNTIGSGEGMGWLALGPGLYAGSTTNLGKLYVKYGGDSGKLSALIIDATNVINPSRKMSPEHLAAYEKASIELNKLGLRTTTLGVKSAMRQAPRHLWQKIRQILISCGIDGMYEILDKDIIEYAIYNPNIIKSIKVIDDPNTPL